jgi:hypothetical protein
MERGLAKLLVAGGILGISLGIGGLLYECRTGNTSKLVQRLCVGGIGAGIPVLFYGASSYYIRRER